MSFAGGVLLMAGLGGALGTFDRGPTDIDVRDARQRGLADGQAEVDVGKEAAAEEQERLGFERGREATEWLSLDRLPNPDGWFAGVAAGRKRLNEMAIEAFQAGVEDGERLGREEGLMFLREQEAGGRTSEPDGSSTQTGSQ
ncbi:MAG: hypothetical protein OXI41_13185 [Chloroflexota bacterium]|nr:hypothetical protein [Chloroflexota bacterium]MDE2895932.1 hypothetical protein [Chloroflexota bacterium]